MPNAREDDAGQPKSKKKILLPGDVITGMVYIECATSVYRLFTWILNDFK